MRVSRYEARLDGYPVQMRLGAEDTAAAERAVAGVVRLIRPFLDGTDIREAVGYEYGDLSVLQLLLGDTGHALAVAVHSAHPDRVCVSDTDRPGRDPLIEPERARFVSPGEALATVRELAGDSL